MVLDSPSSRNVLPRIYTAKETLSRLGVRHNYLQRLAHREILKLSKDSANATSPLGVVIYFD